MAKKKVSQITASEEELEQARQVFKRYRQIAAQLFTDDDLLNVETVLAEINTLPESAQIFLIKDLSKETNADAANVLSALHTASTQKNARKEARRSLLRLEEHRIYPTWTPLTEPVILPDFSGNPSQPLTNLSPSIRFWKGQVTDTFEEAGEAQLLLFWEQGEKYDDVLILGFLLDFLDGGLKDFFVRSETKKSFARRYDQLLATMPATRDCSLAEGSRLVHEALAVNEANRIRPALDYRNNQSQVEALLLEDDEDDEDDEDEDEPLDLHDIVPTGIISGFIQFWLGGDYHAAYQYLASTSPLREDLSMDDWVAKRKDWQTICHPSRLKPGFLLEIEAPKAKKFLSRSEKNTSTTTVDASWSIEIEHADENPLPELPSATAVYQETNRHWFWSSYTLVRENDSWLIQEMTDEGAQALTLSVQELDATLLKLDEQVKERVVNHDSVTDMEELEQFPTVILLLERTLPYIDAYLKKDTPSYATYKEIIQRFLTCKDLEHALLYLQSLIELFPEERTRSLLLLSETYQTIASDYSGEGDVPYLNEVNSTQLGEVNEERQKRYQELAEEALRQSIDSESSFAGHSSLAALLLDKKEFDEAELQLFQAQNLAKSPDEQASVEIDLSNIALKLDQFPEALSYAQHATEILPDAVDPWLALADVYRHMQDFDKATSNYRHAIELDRHNVDTYGLLSEMYRENGQVDLAVQALAEGVEANPTDITLLFVLFTACLATDNFQQAESILNQLEKLEPNFPGLSTYRETLTLAKNVQSEPPTTKNKKLSAPGRKNKSRRH